MGDNPKTALERMNEAWENKSKPLADMTIEEAQAFFDSLAPISEDITIEAARNGDTAAGYLLELEKLGSLMTQTHNVLSSRGIDTAMDEYRREIYGDVKAAELQHEETARKEAEKAAKKMQNGKFDLEDFLSQMKQIKKLGPLENILKMLPGISGRVPIMFHFLLPLLMISRKR